MFTQSAARHRPTSRLASAAGLIALAGVAAAAASGAVPVPARATAQTVQSPTAADHRGPARTADPPVDESPAVPDLPAAAQTPPPPQAHRLPEPVRKAAPDAELGRSLLYSGLLGLLISLIGLSVVGVRRRRW